VVACSERRTVVGRFETLAILRTLSRRTRWPRARLLGHAHFMQRHWVEAEAAYHVALKVQPYVSSYSFDWGTILLVQKKWPRRRLPTAVPVGKPRGTAGPRAYLALALLELDREDEARQAARRQSTGATGRRSIRPFERLA